MAPSYDFQGDWSRMAKLIIHDSLQTQPGEKIIIHADPTYFPELLEQVRIEIVKAGAVELFAGMLYPPGIQSVRRQMRRREDAELIEMEDQALAALFDLADIFIWLPNHWSLNPGQTELILKTWQGRAIHFHWIMAQADADTFRKLSEMYEQALYIDYEALTARQERLAGAMRNANIEITNPAGTDIRFRLEDAHFHRGNGDASKAFINGYARPGSARDREVELPSGAIRTVDILDTEGTLVCSNETFAGREVGTLTYVFHGNRITSVRSEHHNDYVQAMWGLQTGDCDRFGEFNAGVNRALTMLPGHEKIISYYGYGDGIVRFSLGDNQESGGDYLSSYHQWLFLSDATMKANGHTVLENGKLALE